MATKTDATHIAYKATPIALADIMSGTIDFMWDFSIVMKPLIDGGKYPIKRVIGQDLTVEADVFKDGHDVVAAMLKWRKQGETRWSPGNPKKRGAGRTADSLRNLLPLGR